MDEKVVYLHGRPNAIGPFLHIGNTGHRQHCLEKQLTPTARSARNIVKLRVTDIKLKKVPEESNERLENMHSVLDDLISISKNAPRSASPKRHPLASRDASARRT